MDWTYDIETYPNIFTFCAISDDNEGWIFEISDRRNDSKALRGFLKRLYKNKDRMIGFNNLGFDYPVLHDFLYNKDHTYKDIYKKAMSIIEDDSKFGSNVNPKDVLITQLDLYKINHFDNKARATSLKVLEFNMMSPNISDLPYPPGTVLNDHEKDVLVEYNKHDVMETRRFKEHNTGGISFREKLGEKYNVNFMNHNDTKIGKDYFILELEKANKGCCYQVIEGRKVKRQTIRDEIDLGECILDYVKFERPEFNAVVEWLKRQTIVETKGVFNDIPEHELGDVAKYCEMVTKKKKVNGYSKQRLKLLEETYPMGWFEDVELKSGKISEIFYWRVAENLNVIIDGLRYDFGTGGLHASIDSAVVKSDGEYIVRDEDVTSYYPNLSIRNRLYPEHLGEMFCDIYELIFEERKLYPKGTPENLAMKLALNGSYGASNDKFSPMYDPKFTMMITINGQLSLCMLAEKLLKIDDLTMIQLNTDGLTFKVLRDNADEVQSICREWERTTKLELEGVDYESMYIRDVNGYIAVDTGGKQKRKGPYEYKREFLDGEGLGWHQNHSALIIPMAANKALIEGIDIEEFIRKHDNEFDFMLRTKVPRSSRLVLIDEEGVQSPQQNICRYYVSEKGGDLVKIMPPLDKEIFGVECTNTDTGEVLLFKNITDAKKVCKGLTARTVDDVKIKCEPDVISITNEKVLLENPERYIGINTGWKIKTCNDVVDFDWDIDYDYYIAEAEKLVKPLLNTEQ